MTTMSGPRATVAQGESEATVSLPAAQRLYERGVDLREAGQATAAVETLKSAVLADPRHVEARWALADALVESGALPDAIAELEEIVKLVPGTDRAAEATEVILRLREQP